jgi:flagellar biosynthesis regulator FlaF
LELTGHAESWLEARRQMREQTPVKLYGGLTWNEVTQLIRRYQAGTVDLGVFLFAHDCRKTGKSSPLLKLAGTEFVELVMFSGRERLLVHLNKAIALLKRYENKAEQRVALGYVNRWKMHVLLYMLRHPSEFYLTRELRAHLATLGMKIDSKSMRRFCNLHGIKRDILPGRPRQTKNPPNRR